MAGVNVPGALVLGDLASTTSVAIGRGGALTIDNSSGPGGVSFLGPLAAAGFAPNFGSNPLVCGALNCGAITAAGGLSLGSNTAACGPITSAGPLNLGSNPVSCGAIAASGDVTCPRYFAALRFASSGATQAISNTTNTLVSWTTQVAGTGIAFSNPTSTFTIPVAGWYNLTCGLTFGASATGTRSVWFLVNGSVSTAKTTDSGVSGDYTRLGISLQRQLAAGDTVAVQVFQNSGGTVSIGSDGADFKTRFEINRLSA